MPRAKGRGLPQLGQRLALCLSEQGMSESDLAARSGVSQSYISRILRGQVTNPTIEFAMRLAHALNMTVSEFLGETSALPTAPRDRDELLDSIQRRINELHQLFDELRRNEPR
jgi:transcriptional regulator with XRE-family HTH domain